MDPKIVNITSEFGSISGNLPPPSPGHKFLDPQLTKTHGKGNSFGTCMAYRAAKAAANQVTVTLAREWEKEGRNVTIVCMEPGFLFTRLTG